MGTSELWEDHRCGLSLCLVAFSPWNPGLITGLTLHLVAVYKQFHLGQDPGQSVLWVVVPEQ